MKAGPLLGIDYGTRRVGLAVSDPSGTVATPLGKIEAVSERKTAEAIGRLCRERMIAGVVVGLPLNMDGSRGPAAEQAVRFADLLNRRLGLPVTTWDERMTTVSAARVLREGGLNARRSRGKIDQLAAQIMLQHYLDAQAFRAEKDLS